jgi:biopolymer transport protein ExbD
MARRHRHEAFEEDAPELNISSLIDVCFLLLVYFLVTTTLQKRETDLDLRMAGDEPVAERLPIEPLLIRIDASGAVYTGPRFREMLLDTDPDIRDLPLLSQQLELYASASRSSSIQPLVQISADDEASQQRVIDVLNALAGKGISNITFTDTNPPG